MLQEEGSAPTAQGRMGLKLFVATCKLAGNIISSFCKSLAASQAQEGFGVLGRTPHGVTVMGVSWGCWYRVSVPCVGLVEPGVAFHGQNLGL